jgi:hypothetical protein
MATLHHVRRFLRHKDDEGSVNSLSHSALSASMGSRFEARHAG